MAIKICTPCFPNPPSNLGLKAKIVGYVALLITSKVLDVRRRGGTTEAYRVIRRKPAPAKAGGGATDGNAVRRYFDIAQHRP